MGLDSVEWVMLLESEFGVAIPDEVAESLRTPRAAIEFIAPRADPSLWHRDRIERRVLEISAEQFGRASATVRLDSDIVHDLGAD